jgi:hypothetical protein
MYFHAYSFVYVFSLFTDKSYNSTKQETSWRIMEVEELKSAVLGMILKIMQVEGNSSKVPSHFKEG